MKIYTAEDIRQAFRNVGLEKGDTVFIHANLGFFGILQGAKLSDEYAHTFLSILWDIVGTGGNICVPTFTYSFCNSQPYDLLTTPSNMGIFSEYLRANPESVRSGDANFSVSVLGHDAKLLTKNAPTYSFGKNSFWERFMELRGKICNMNFDAGSTFVHYVEKMMNVPYRYDKKFTGNSLISGKWEERTFYHFVRHLDKPEWDTSMPRFDRLARKNGIVSSVNLGGGNIITVKAKDVYKTIEKAIEADPYYLTVGKGDIV